MKSYFSGPSIEKGLESNALDCGFLDYDA